MTLDAAVWLDAQGAQNLRHPDRGIPRYVAEHTHALVRVAPATVPRVVVARDRPVTGPLGWLLGDARLAFTDEPPPQPPAVYHVMSPVELERPIDVVWPGWARGDATRLVVTAYDLIPRLFPDVYLSHGPTRVRYDARLALLRRADHVLAISQTTAADVERLLRVPGERITVIDAGATTSFAGAFPDPERALLALGRRLPNLREGFALYVGGIDPRKNMERLIEAWGLLPPRLRSRHQLVLTCRTLPEEAAALRAHGDAAGLGEDDLIITGYVTDTELGALYHACRLFVFASYYEGSGLPLLEAMSIGLPVAASRASTTPEILGDLEATFDPFDARDMAAVIGRALTDEPLRRRLRTRSLQRVGRFTWDRVAQRSLAGYEAALRRRPKGAPRRRRPRLALVTPWPPAPSGVATYSSKLAGALRDVADVEIATDAPRPGVPGLRRASALAPVVRVGRHDAVVHCMGNSSFHRHVHEAMAGVPGAVLLHDVRLVGFYGWYAGIERPEDPTGRLAERLAAEYGDRLGPGSFADRPPDAEEQFRLGLLLTAEVRALASRIVVHSQHARGLLAGDARDGVLPPVDVIPHAYPEVAGQTGLEDRDADHVVCFGIVSPVKGVHTLLEAFALVLLERPTAKLTFAGGASPDELRWWRDEADRLGIGDVTKFTGHLGEQRWQELLRTATLAVQLRTTTNGESSGVIVECLAAGLPVVASDLGQASELPAEAVARLSYGAPPAAVAAEVLRLLGDPRERRDRALAGMDVARRWPYPAVARALLEALL